jgi:hypothetical protein
MGSQPTPHPRRWPVPPPTSPPPPPWALVKTRGRRPAMDAKQAATNARSERLSCAPITGAPPPTPASNCCRWSQSQAKPTTTEHSTTVREGAKRRSGSLGLGRNGAGRLRSGRWRRPFSEEGRGSSMVSYRRVRWSRRAGGMLAASNGLGGGGWALQDQEEDTVLIF